MISNVSLSDLNSVTDNPQGF